jgi:putative hemolysin
MTGAELRGIVASHTELTVEERELIDDVFDAGETRLREVMIPRTEVEFLPAAMPVFRAAAIVSRMPHSRYPITGESADDVVGFVHVRDILNPGVVDRSIRLERLAREVVFFPGSKQVIPALAEMRREGYHLAVVADEYGGTAGIVTLEDLVEELVGDIRDEYDSLVVRPALSPGQPQVVDGLLSIEDFADEVGLELVEGPYETVAGWLVAQLGRLPVVGDSATVADHQVTVVELDGRRISRVAVAPVGVPPEPLAGGTDDDPTGDEV